LTVTLPKARLAVLTVSCGTAAAVPVPLSATVVVPDAELIASRPATAPAVVGLNRT